MKKICSILSILMIISFTIAGVLSSIGYQNVATFEELLNETRNIEVSSSIEEIDLSTIEVDTLNILSTNEDNIYVELHGEYKSTTCKDVTLNIDSYRNSIKITMKKTRIFNFINLEYYSNNVVLDIYIPEKYNGSLELNTVCNNLNINNINIDKTKIEGIIENIQINKFSGRLEIDSVSSNIEITYVDFNDDLEINSIASDVYINLPIGSEYSVEQNAIPSSITYYIDNERTDRTRTNSRNKIEINGLNSDLSINEYTENADI